MSDVDNMSDVAPDTNVLPQDIAQQAGQIKLFSKWAYDDVEVRDISLTDYIQIVRAEFISFEPGGSGAFTIELISNCSCTNSELSIHQETLHFYTTKAYEN